VYKSTQSAEDKISPKLNGVSFMIRPIGCDDKRQLITLFDAINLEVERQREPRGFRLKHTKSGGWDPGAR